MTNKEILEKSFEIAAQHSEPIKLARELLFKNGFPEDIVNGGYKALIFNHDFAKAFWGEDNIEVDSELLEGNYGFDYRISKWEYHLMKMVLEENPLKYLEKFL